MPVCLSNLEAIHYVLRNYVTEDAEEPITQVHFMARKTGGKSAAFIEELAPKMS